MDLRRLVSWAAVGLAVALAYVAIYAGLRRLGLPELTANALAFGAAIALQYAGQAALTFRRPLGEPRQIGRFLVMIGAGFLVSSLVTGRLGPALGWSDAGAAAAVAVILPVQNLILMSAWVFARAPHRREA